MDVPGILNSTTKKELTKAAIWLLESMAKEIRLENEMRNSLEDKKRISKQTMLFDMEGLSMKTAAYKPGWYWRVLIFSIK